MNQKKACYRECISSNFLVQPNVWQAIEEILPKIKYKSKRGRKPIDIERAINGIFYLLRTGIHWKALPACFGSASAVYRTFTKLIQANFFKLLWTTELQKYFERNPKDFEVQALDCAHIKSPLGHEKTGKSPVDRRKLGTKRSIVSTKSGIPLGCALGPGNQHDSQLLVETLQSIPIPGYLTSLSPREMQLDSAYDSDYVRTALFNFYYTAKIRRNKRKSKQPIPNIPTPFRWISESVHSWMNRFRRLLIRFDKLSDHYLSFMHFSFALIIFRRFLI